MFHLVPHLTDSIYSLSLTTFLLLLAVSTIVFQSVVKANMLSVILAGIYPNAQRKRNIPACLLLHLTSTHPAPFVQYCFMWVDNRYQFGYLTVPDTRTTEHLHNDLWEIFSNPKVSSQSTISNLAHVLTIIKCSGLL